MGKDLKGKELGDGISQRTDGSYMGRFTDRFGKRKSFYSVNLKEVKAKLADAIYEDKNRMNLSDDTIILDDWFEKWLNIHKFNTIRLNTKRHYIHVYKKHISPKLGKRRLCDINQLMIREVIKGLIEKGYQFETQNKVKVLLVDMFDKAIIDDFARKNPARGIKLVRDESEIKNVRVLTIEEQQEFFDCCKGTFYDNLFTVAINTGLRPGEVCALKWEDINFDKMEISVERTLLYQKLEGDEQKTFHFEFPKTKQSKRKVPMNKTCAIALKKQKLQSNIVKAKSVRFSSVPDEFKELLFTTSFGTPINSVVLNDAIGRIINEINLIKDPIEEFERFSAHCFRHTFATRCFESGIQPKTVQSYLGHASLKMTMDLYTHVLDTKKQEEMDKLAETMDKISNISEDELEDLVDKRFKEIADKNNNIIPLFGVV